MKDCGFFICTFDIFEGKRHKYTFRNLCEEDNSVKLNDGTTKMFLSTKGEKNDVSKALKNFLDYVDGHAPADELMKEIDTEVVTAKSCDEWRLEYMTLELEIKRREKLAAAEAEARGEARTKTEDIKNLVKNMKLSAEAAMKALGIPQKDFAKYMAML